MGRYEELFQKSIKNPEGFWAQAAEAITWIRSWNKVLDDSNKPFYRWFSGAELNTCFNAVDRHAMFGRADQVAIIYDSPVTNTVQKITYRELLDLVSRFAGALANLGVGKGDTVIIYMPMIPQAVIAMLACARLGAVHSVVFGGFAPHELAIRIDDAKPKIIITASGAIEGKKILEYKPMLDKAIEAASHKPEKNIIFQRQFVKSALIPGRDLDWDELMAGAQPVECTPVKATDPLYILYTSGTTGKPKGVLHTWPVGFRILHKRCVAWTSATLPMPRSSAACPRARATQRWPRIHTVSSCRRQVLSSSTRCSARERPRSRCRTSRPRSQQDPCACSGARWASPPDGSWSSVLRERRLRRPLTWKCGENPFWLTATPGSAWTAMSSPGNATPGLSFLIAASFLYRPALACVAPPMYAKIAPTVARIAVTTAS